MMRRTDRNCPLITHLAAKRAWLCESACGHSRLLGLLCLCLKELMVNLGSLFLDQAGVVVARYEGEAPETITEIRERLEEVRRR